MTKMKHWASTLATLGLGLGLSGCGFSGVGDVYHLQATTATGGTPFTRALSDEYRVQANEEANIEAEWDDAGWFARRGLQAANGEMVLPVDPTTMAGERVPWHWRVPPNHRLVPLVNARAQLLAALDGGARERVPGPAAHVQAVYDCWAEEEAEGDLFYPCEAEYLRLISTIQVVQVVQVAQGERHGYQVFFQWDKSNITGDAANVIRRAAESARQERVTLIGLTGHTDSSGSNKYNQALSERRAAAVRAELVRNGVPESEIQTLGVGEAGQLVATADEVREVQNRRVVIVLQK